MWVILCGKHFSTVLLLLHTLWVHRVTFTSLCKMMHKNILYPGYCLKVACPETGSGHISRLWAGEQRMLLLTTACSKAACLLLLPGGAESPGLPLKVECFRISISGTPLTAFLQFKLFSSWLFLYLMWKKEMWHWLQLLVSFMKIWRNEPIPSCLPFLTFDI